MHRTSEEGDRPGLHLHNVQHTLGCVTLVMGPSVKSPPNRSSPKVALHAGGGTCEQCRCRWCEEWMDTASTALDYLLKIIATETDITRSRRSSCELQEALISVCAIDVRFAS